jgi:hypothetical protein
MDGILQLILVLGSTETKWLTVKGIVNSNTSLLAFCVSMES